MDKMENITIPMEEYKELLIIKGRYEELKGQETPKILLRGTQQNRGATPEDYL